MDPIAVQTNSTPPVRLLRHTLAVVMSLLECLRANSPTLAAAALPPGLFALAYEPRDTTVASAIVVGTTIGTLS